MYWIRYYLQTAVHVPSRDSLVILLPFSPRISKRAKHAATKTLLQYKLTIPSSFRNFYWSRRGVSSYLWQYQQECRTFKVTK